MGVYNESLFNETNGTCSAIHSAYGYAIARSVSYFQMFVRPVGDVLTNETVRDVIHQEMNQFSDEFAVARKKLSTVADAVYRLVRIAI